MSDCGLPNTIKKCLVKGTRLRMQQVMGRGVRLQHTRIVV